MDTERNKIAKRLKCGGLMVRISTSHCVEQDQLRSILERQRNCKMESHYRLKSEIGGIEDSLHLHRYISMRRDAGTHRQDGTRRLVQNLFRDRTAGGRSKTGSAVGAGDEQTGLLLADDGREHVPYFSPLENHSMGDIPKLLLKKLAGPVLRFFLLLSYFGLLRRVYSW